MILIFQINYNTLTLPLTKLTFFLHYSTSNKHTSTLFSIKLKHSHLALNQTRTLSPCPQSPTKTLPPCPQSKKNTPTLPSIKQEHPTLPSVKLGIISPYSHQHKVHS